MKKKVLILASSVFVLLSSQIYTQIQFAPHTIIGGELGADGAKSVYAIDMDSDNDMDVLSASAKDDKIIWYENDGSQNFTAHIITTNADGAKSVYAIDLDGDTDVDVLSASSGDDKIIWYENDGNQNFIAHTITSDADWIQSIYAVDLDGDLDVDVFSASGNDDKIAWYENDGSQNFTAHIITTNADGAKSVYAIDMDSDNDMDVLSASCNDDKIAWYENDGSQNFITHLITTKTYGAYSIYAIDLDNDNDMDVLSVSAGLYSICDAEVAWYENDGNQNFITHTIATSPDELQSVYAIDLDGDSDMDVLSASDYKVAWYENSGSQDFAQHIITTNVYGAKSVYAIDLDGDTDVDVLSASSNDDKITWYENLINTSVDNNNQIQAPGEFQLYNNYPNPFNPATQIEFDVKGNLQVILKIYDILGREVATLVNQNLSAGHYKVVFNAKNLESGVYIYHIQMGKFQEAKKMILQK